MENYSFCHLLSNQDFAWYLTYAITGAITGSTAVFLLYLIYRPFNRVRDAYDVGFWSLKDQESRKGKSLRELANEFLRCRKIGEIPPIYPNGWFCVAESRELKRKDIKSVNALGENLVIFRDEDGHIHIVDAYCPHLGAHMGMGSKVRGNCIECPFHGWRFGGDDGKCIGIPYTDKVPEFAKLKTWPCREVNGHIYVWYHAEGIEVPTWEPIRIAEVSDGHWAYHGRTEHYINAHIQEIPENGADMAHFAQVHKANMLSGTDLRKLNGPVFDLVSHVWDASWTANDGPNSHVANVWVHHDMRLFGKMDLVGLDVQVKQIGPAIVHLTMETAFGKALIIQNVTPVEPLRQRLIHQLYAERTVPTIYAKFVLFGHAVMVERDVGIWNHKMFLNRPLILKEEKYIKQMRRWYSQFYSENSPRFSFRKDSLGW